jgi:hypothetical protein
MSVICVVGNALLKVHHLHLILLDMNKLKKNNYFPNGFAEKSILVLEILLKPKKNFSKNF